MRLVIESSRSLAASSSFCGTEQQPLLRPGEARCESLRPTESPLGLEKPAAPTVRVSMLTREASIKDPTQDDVYLFMCVCAYNYSWKHTHAQGRYIRRYVCARKCNLQLHMCTQTDRQTAYVRTLIYQSMFYVQVVRLFLISRLTVHELHSSPSLFSRQGATTRESLDSHGTVRPVRDSPSSETDFSQQQQEACPWVTKEAYREIRATMAPPSAKDILLSACSRNSKDNNPGVLARARGHLPGRTALRGSPRASCRQ